MKRISDKKRLQVYNKSNRCMMCDMRIQNDIHTQSDYMQVDHLLPRRRGGSNNIENLMPLCKSCNSSKKDRDSVDVAMQIKNDVSKAFKDYHERLISYEKKHGALSKEEFHTIINETMFMFTRKINNLIEAAK